MSATVHQIGHTEVTVDHDEHHVRVALPCGCTFVAAPTADQDEFARRLGYRDAWAMTAEHDLLHAQIAAEAGMTCSPVHYLVAHHLGLDTDAVRREEAAVLGLAAELNRR